MSPVDFALIFFLLLVVFNYWVHRSVLYPPFIFSILWFFDLLVVRLDLIEINPVHTNTLAIVAGGALSFSIGGLLSNLAPRTLFQIHLFSPKPKRSSDFIRNTLMIGLLCGLPVMFYQTLQLSRSLGGSYLVLAQARQVIVEASLTGTQNGSMVLLSYFVMAATYTSLLLATEKKGWKLWVVTIVAFIACILSTGRTDLLFLIAGLSAIQLLQRKQESLRSALRFLRWPIASFVALWTGLEFTNKNSDEMTGGIAGIATHYVLIYISGPLAAFDSVVQHPAEFMMTTSHVLRFPLKVAAALHMTAPRETSTFDSFVPVPFPINVYTVFKYDYLELGIVGMLLLLIFLGFFHSFIYLKATQGGRFSTYLFACLMYPVLMVTFDDEYFLTGLNPHALVFGFLYLLIGSMQLRLFSTPQRAPLLANAG